MVGAVASGLGYLVRALLVLLRSLPGIVGPLLVIYGVDLIYRPAGWIVAGLMVWALDVIGSAPVKRTERSTE
jgi:hypothetical protein